MICVSIGRTRHKMMVAEHAALAERGAQLVELRLDYLQRAAELSRLLPNRPTPVIVTCRRGSDKGLWAGTEDQRLTLLRAAIVQGVDYVDLEEDTAKAIRRYGKTKRIVSYHNFDETPQDLEEIHARLAALDADIVKLATMAQHPADNVRMLKLVAQSKVPTVGFCMGEMGMISRVLTGRYGAPFTYAAVSKERSLAPGQLTFEELKLLYRYDSIDSDTEIYGVLADPVAHSMSPLIHNSAFVREKLNKVYLPLRVPGMMLGLSLEAFRWLNIKGYSVTIPHKQAIVELAKSFDGPVQEIGAANTLFRAEDVGPQSAWTAANTDYHAALETLCQALNEIDGMASADAAATTPSAESIPSADGAPAAAAPLELDQTVVQRASPLAGRRVLILGCGGVARAIALAVMNAGAALTVTNRTSARGKELAKDLGCQFIGWENRGTVYADVLINCTSVGMHPKVDESPFVENWLREGMLVFDTVYNPEQTLLLKQARDRGCHAATGVEMFVRQAARQYQYFTGRPGPIELMRKVVRRAISHVKVEQD